MSFSPYTQSAKDRSAALRTSQRSAQDVLTLGQCRSLAEQNNIGIRQADNSIAGAEEDVKNANAAFYSKVEGSDILYHHWQNSH